MALSREKLVGDLRVAKLREIPEWHEVEGRDAIKRTFVFKDFKAAWAFMSKVAEKAEEVWSAFSPPAPFSLCQSQLDHHPEWFNVYNRVEVTLATHTCNGVSEYDVALAKAMDTFATSL
jgi:4a-hydroxytetrahydrobiopterin dehydratase